MELSRRISPRVWSSALRLANTISAGLVHGRILGFLLNKTIAAANDERVPFDQFIERLNQLNFCMFFGLCVLGVISYATMWEDEGVLSLLRLALGSFLFQSGVYTAFRFYLNSSYNRLFPVIRLDDEMDFIAFMWGVCATCGGIFILLFPDKALPCADDRD